MIEAPGNLSLNTIVICINHQKRYMHIVRFRDPRGEVAKRADMSYMNRRNIRLVDS